MAYKWHQSAIRGNAENSKASGQTCVLLSFTKTTTRVYIEVNLSGSFVTYLLPVWTSFSARPLRPWPFSADGTSPVFGKHGTSVRLQPWPWADCHCAQRLQQGFASRFQQDDKGCESNVIPTNFVLIQSTKTSKWLRTRLHYCGWLENACNCLLPSIVGEPGGDVTFWVTLGAVIRSIAD